MKKILLSIALFSAVFLFISGCSTVATKQGRDMAKSGDTEFFVDVPAGLASGQIKNAILASLIEREWTVVGDSDGVITAELDRVKEREIYGKIAITYTSELITIKDHSIDDKGESFVPIRWLKYLAMSMTKFMAAVAPAS